MKKAEDEIQNRLSRIEKIIKCSDTVKVEAAPHNNN